MRTKLFLFISIIIYPLFGNYSYALTSLTSGNLYKSSVNPLDEILKQWHNRTEMLSLGKEKIAIDELSNLSDVMAHYSIRNAPEIAIALLKEIEERKSELTPKENLFLAAAAIKIAPDIPTVHFKTASYYFKWDTLNIRKGISELLDGLSIYFDDIDSRLNLYANLLYWTSLAFIITLISFFLISGMKYIPLLAHLLTHILPQIFSKFSIYTIIFTIPILMFLTLGPLSIIFILIIYFWIFSNTSEKFISIVTLILVTTLPLLFYLLPFPIKYQESVERKILISQLSSDYLSNLDRFLELVEKKPDDIEIKFTVALLYKKIGDLQSAANLLDQIIKKRPNWDKPYINIGNIEFIRGNFNSAISNYSKAASSNRNSFLAKYNVGKAFYSEARIEEANLELKNANTLNPTEFQKYEEISDPKSPTRSVFDETITADDLNDRIQSLQNMDTPLSNTLWIRAGLINLSPSISSLVGILTILFLIILSKLSKAIDSPQACRICGTPFCKRCGGVKDKKDTCPQCFHIFVLKESVESNFRSKKEAKEKRNRLLNNIFKNWASFLFPGFGHMYLDSAIRGVTVTFIFSGTLIRLILAKGWVSNPFALSLKSSPLATISLLSLALVVYIYANLSLSKD